ncbi:SurA N-terminal domain-containing protein [Geopsychrobacter electrodiphilus]|uniref:SurA N-terminal domain-containing protein n=1 Tax=Geopsychrobacter electrodiphilus TaxID=225196 RepID=UPI000375E50B|nr:SurA N-terminal domain-containing protein [Geopsychrobacter electrodiphilus]
MLHMIRTKQKTIIVKIIFWVIIAAFIGTIFLVWGHGGDKGASGKAAALQINDTKISYEEFQSAYSNLYNLYQGIYKENFTPQLEKQLNLKQQAVDQLIGQSLLMQEAEKTGLEVSKDELVNSIATYPAFQVDGKFNRNRYIQVLNYEKISAEQFEASQRRQLLVDKLRKQLQQGVSVSADEINQAFRKENDRINLNFVRLLPASFENKVTVTDEVLKTYFKDHQEDFRLPEKISLRYLKFDPASYAKEVTSFSKEDLNRYYRRNINLFEVKEQAKASHILIKVAKDADATQKKARRAIAESILKELKAGKDFATLARAKSDDPGSAAKGGELGYFGRGAMVAPFDKAVFNLKPGELSGIVESDFGYHIIKLEDYIEPGVKTLAEAMDQVKQGLRTEKERQIAYEKAMDAYNINRKNGNLDAAAKANDLTIKETSLFARTDAIDGIGREEEIISAAFSLNDGELGHPVQTSQGVYLFTIKERQQSRIPELKEVRTAVEADYRKTHAIDLAKEAADNLLKQATEMKSLSAAAKAAKFQVEETGLFSRSYGAFIPRIGTSQELSDAAFSLTSEKPLATKVFKQGAGYVLVSLKQSEKSDPAKLDTAERKKIEDRLLSQKKEAIINDKLKTLREAAEITIDPSLTNDRGRR